MSGERVVHDVVHDGVCVGHVLMCPACGFPHMFSTDQDPRRSGKGWRYNGDPVRPTFQPSMLVTHPGDGGPRCHSFVTDGTWRFLADSTHELAGQTVPCEPWDTPGYMEEP